MNIYYEGKYKSITKIDWKEISKLAIITGPNGTGKSQLLDLIYETFTSTHGEKATITNHNIKPNEITYLKGEWQLNNSSHINLSRIQQIMDTHFGNFQSHNYSQNQGAHQIKMYYACQEVITKTGKSPTQVTREEFDKYFPAIFFEQESQISEKIGEVFYNYRLNEIELLSKNKSTDEIIKEIGEKPWVVLREILKESKLPFEINDASEIGFRDGFTLKLTHKILNEEIHFNNLSSGEKVLISLVFYLYNSQEQKVFPKLLLLDEPDAHLHPSMSQQFLNVIKNVLVDKFGVQVIATTHSPSTVILAPYESIYEMSREEPRIRKSPSKNHSVSLLTSGLVYVGEGTKYLLVEDNDDAKFYTYVNNQLLSENQINSNVPLVFISASTKEKSGGKDAVRNWVNKLQDSGLVNIVNGLIDEDNGNEISEGIYKIDRYSIENYLIDPLIVFATLIDVEKPIQIEGINISLGEEYKLKSLSNSSLQKICDEVFKLIEFDKPNNLIDFSADDMILVKVNFLNGIELEYPRWVLKRKGKDILNKLYQHKFTSVINYSSLFKTFKKLNMFPLDLISVLEKIKTGN